MEIIEAIFAFTQLCGCFLDLAALGVNGCAAYTGYQVYRDRKRPNSEAEPEKPRPTMWRFLVWLIIGVALLVLVVLKWTAAYTAPPAGPR